MAIVLDIIIVAVFAAVLIWNICRGFIKSLTGLISFIVALIVAVSLSTPIAQWVYSSYVEPTVWSAVEQLQTDATQSAEVSADAVLESLPVGIRSLLASVGVESGETLTAKLSPDSEGSLIHRIVSDVIAPAASSLIRMIVMLVLFLLTLVIASLLLKLVDKIFKNLPILKGINRTLGFIPGIINGVLAVLLALTVMQVLCSLGVLITAEQMQQTVLVRWLAEINPFAFKIG